MGIIPIGRGIIVTPSAPIPKRSHREPSKEEIHFMQTGFLICAIISLICLCRWFFKFRHIRNNNWPYKDKWTFSDYLTERSNIAFSIIKIASVGLTCLVIIVCFIELLSKIIF